MTGRAVGEIVDPLELSLPPNGPVMRNSFFVVAFSAAVSGALVAQVPDTAAARAEALYSSHDYLGAAAAFQALTQRNPQQPRYWTRMGSSYQRAGRLDDALNAYRHAIGLTIAP